METPNINNFDNDISILIKWAQYLQSPSSLVFKDNQNIYKTSLQVVPELIKSGYDISGIYDLLKDKLNITDIVYNYAYSHLSNLNEVLPEINRFNQENGLNEIEDENELRLILSGWRDSLLAKIEDDKIYLEELDIIHQELSNYPSLFHSPIKIETVKINAYPVWKNNQKITLFDGISIFDQSVISEHVPYLSFSYPKFYNNSSNKSSNKNKNKNKSIKNTNKSKNKKKDEVESNKLYKIFKGKTVEDLPNYQNVIPSPNTAKVNNFLFSVWTNQGIFKSSTKDNFLKVNYELADKIIIKKVPIQNNIDNIIIQNIENALPIKLTNIEKTSISGEFYVYDVEINDIFLIDMVLNSELMSSYIFAKEMIDSYAEKKQLKLYFRGFSPFEEEELTPDNYIINPSSVNMSITQSYSKEGEIIEVLNDSDQIQKFKLNANTPYIRVKFTQAESPETVKRFAKIFSHLLSYYKSNVANIEKIYTTFIPELKESSEVKITKVISRGKGDSKISRLHEIAPEIFVSGYARLCQTGDHQPLIIDDSEIEEWKNRSFIYKNKMRNRQIMNFLPNNLPNNLPENPNLKLVCPSDNAPFPGVILNKNLKNKEDYPCLPCCFVEDQINNPKSKYNKCFGEKEVKKIKEIKETHKKRTDKILKPDSLGFIPKQLTNLIDNGLTDVKNILRRGVIRSPNSLLHCISIAISDPSYISSNDKEDYIKKLRQVIANQVHPELLKQELYDYSANDIQKQLKDNSMFLDPNLFYRAVEEVYKINLYVFSPGNIQDKEDSPSITIPRYKLFHSRINKDLPVILIYRTWGSERDDLEYPQCEIITNFNEETNDQQMVFEAKNSDNENIMNKFLRNAILYTNRNITWNIDNSNLVARQNIYSLINYYELFGNSATKQIIDSYGKMRALIFPTGVDDQEMTVIFPPSQPVNLPVSTLVRVDSELALEILSNPIAVTRNNKDEIDGLWYSILDIEYGIYVPITPTLILKSVLNLELKVGPPNPIPETRISVSRRIDKLYRDLSFIKQIIIWLYLLSNLTVTDFLNNYFIIGNQTVTDSSNVYDFSNLGLLFPNVKTVEEGIDEMMKIVPSLFYQGKIFIYSQKFFDGLRYFLDKIDKDVDKTEIEMKEIYRENITENDFKSSPYNVIFISEKDMITWRNQIENSSFSYLNINHKLDISNSLITDPYLYTDDLTRKIYIVQNVIEGNRYRAIRLAYNWYLTKQNTGYKTEEIKKNEVPVHVVYGISPSLSLVLLENNAGNGTQYLQLLNYGNDRFGAMLPLL